MRFASVDNRSRSMWLLAGLGVFIWVAFGVFFGGSSAHAEEIPAGASHSHSSHSHPSPSHAQQKHASHSDAPQKHAQLKHARKQDSPPRGTHVQPQRQPISQVLHKAAPARQIPPVARSLQKQAKHTIVRVAGLQHQNRQNAHAWNHDNADKDHAGIRHGDKDHAGNRGDHAHSRHASSRAAQAATHKHPVIRAQHRSPAAAAPAVPVVKMPASITPTEASDPPSENSPADSHSTSAQHPPAAPLTASSAAAGQTAPAGDLPDAVRSDDLRSLLLTAAHADDDVLPTGPVAPTDNSPD